MTSIRPRWYDYVFAEDAEESLQLWNAASPSGSRTLLICGAGFDPRTLDVPRLLDQRAGSISEVLALRPPAEGEHPEATDAADQNVDQLQALFGDRLTLVDAPTVTDPSTSGLVLARKLVRDYGILTFDTVLLDMSGLPSSMSFTLLHLVFRQSEPNLPVSLGSRFDGNLLVSIAEDASTDERIRATGLGEPSVLPGFARRPDESRTCIWVPVLGRGADAELRALATFFEPDEVCPVVPFPAVDARRGDDLLVEHRELLVDVLQFEARNLLYASELNPFDLYRQLTRLALRYRRALAPLGGVTIVVSEHSSKLLSLGVVMAAHECDLVIGHVRPTAYRLEPPSLNPRRTSIHTAWLTGQPYR